jgi:hypothetical protein
MNELERFHTNACGGQVAPGLWLTLQIDLGEKPDETMESFLDVMHSWLEVAAELDPEEDNWPTNEQWKQLLPPWFIATFEDYSLQEARESGWRWHYGSWLDSMKERVWTWWGYQRRDKILLIELQLDSWPYSVGALKYLARVSGGQLTVVEDRGLIQNSIFDSIPISSSVAA